MQGSTRTVGEGMGVPDVNDGDTDDGDANDRDAGISRPAGPGLDISLLDIEPVGTACVETRPFDAVPGDPRPDASPLDSPPPDTPAADTPTARTPTAKGPAVERPTAYTAATAGTPTGSRITPIGAPTDGNPLHFRRVVSFHPRGGRLNDVQRRAWEAHADRWYLDPAQLMNGFDLMTTFGRDAPLVVEVGSGMGESTAAMAAARPEINLLAIEVYKPGVAQTFHHLARVGATNVRVLRGDAIDVLTELIPAGSLTELWLFFPDPWPKTRHLKRRLVTPAFAELAATRLRPGGTLRMATDWAPYAKQMLAVGTATAALRNEHSGWAPRPAFRPKTRFERRGIAADRKIYDLAFAKR